ncbi:hypothetical protein Tco_0240217, partial [Tanacetum coccineum]
CQNGFTKDELHQMTLDHSSSSLGHQCQIMSDHNSSDLAPQRQMASAKNNTSGPTSHHNDRWRLLKITLQAPFINVQMTFVHIRSGLVLHQMTYAHNRSELEIHVHNKEPSSSKLVPKVVPLAVKTTTSRQELELLFHHHIAMLRTTGK